MMQTLALRLYGVVMTLAQPLLRRKLARRAVAEPGYLQALPERFGHGTTPVAPGALWVHAVSLGETRAAAILLAQLRAQHPGLRVLLTHGTATGRAEGARLLRAGDHQAWLPWDTPGAVARFLDHHRPCLGALLETEVWPTLVAQCRARGVPLVLANARLSEKSLRSARRLSWLARAAYGGLAAVWAQTEADAQRLRLLGAPVQGVFGNLKFDATPDAAQLAQGRAWRAAGAGPVVMFASSREGEEACLLQILMQKQPIAPVESMQSAPVSGANATPPPRWLIVPRHPQRFNAVAELATRLGWRVSRRSTWGEGGPPAGQSPELWLGDSLGEMALYYGMSDVALLGGSFAPLGGQNLIEAAACACPVVMGPHTFNFAEVAELAQAAGAATRVADMGAAVAHVLASATDPLVAARARAFAAAHQGAAGRTAAAVLAVARLADGAPGAGLKPCENAPASAPDPGPAA